MLPEKNVIKGKSLKFARFFFSDTKFSTKICQSGAIRAIYPILKHLSGKVGNLYPVLQVRPFSLRPEGLEIIADHHLVSDPCF
jgi:hypothetical protein